MDDIIIENLDRTYIEYVLFAKEMTPYTLAKKSGISSTTIYAGMNGKQSLKWETLSKIELATGIAFKCQEHISYATEKSFIGD